MIALYCRYCCYGLLLFLGACALGSSIDETRSDWDTVFSDATSGKPKTSNDADISAVGKGGKR